MPTRCRHWGRWRRRGRTSAFFAVLSLATPKAQAFCGFYVSGSSEHLYNKATRVALMREGTRTVLSMSSDYEGPPEDFALVVPVPTVVEQSQVRTLPMHVFDRLDALSAPRLVEYWEQDPCARSFHIPNQASGTRGFAVSTSLTTYRAPEETHSVHVDARFAVGEYDVVVLSARESDGLEAWLHERNYRVPQGASAWLAPYVRGGWRFFVARVNLARVARLPDGDVRLSPLRIQYDADELRLPVRLGLLNAPPDTPQDLIVYILHPTARFEVANLPNRFVPTNLAVAPGVNGVFPAFYAGLFDATMAAARGRAVVTEYAWETASCDPCSVPPLDAVELATLGRDVMPDSDASSMVLTRLHTRYNAATLREDLVFREGFPVVGGRGTVDGSHEGLPTTDGNSFQARYVINHPWTGPADCPHPRRGILGGPTNSSEDPPITAAQELASTLRGAVDLPALVLTNNPGVDLRAHLILPPVSPTTCPSPEPVPTGIHHGCGCDIRRLEDNALPARALTLMALLALRRRGR